MLAPALRERGAAFELGAALRAGFDRGLGWRGHRSAARAFGIRQRAEFFKHETGFGLGHDGARVRD